MVHMVYMVDPLLLQEAEQLTLAAHKDLSRIPLVERATPAHTTHHAGELTLQAAHTPVLLIQEAIQKAAVCQLCAARSNNE